MIVDRGEKKKENGKEKKEAIDVRFIMSDIFRSENDEKKNIREINRNKFRA